MKYFCVLFFTLVPVVGFASDFSWLLDKKPTDSGEFAWDPRSALVLKKIIPEMKIFRNAAPDLAGVVRIDIMLPDPKRVLDQRYVIFTGGRPHDATTHGLLWIDTTDQTGAFATNECLGDSKRGGCMTVGSRSYTASELPAPFIAELKAWLKNEEASVTLRYIDKTGKISSFARP